MFRLPIQRQYQNLNKLGVVTVPPGGQTQYEQFHPGVDIANVKGTPISAPANGVVESVVTGKRQGDNGFGNSVTIKDMQGNRHQLNHLDSVGVHPGQRVQAGGKPIVTMGNSGSAYSPSGKGDGTHVDYRLVNAYGRYKNPMTYVRNLKYGS